MAANRGQYIQSFILTINDDIKLYKQLHRLIAEQKALYLQFQGEALMDNIQRQEPVLNQLGRNASLRSDSLKQLGLPDNASSVLRLFKALPEQIRNPVQKQWQTLNGLIERCQLLNQENGDSVATFHELLNQLTQPSPTYTERMNDL